MTRYIASIDQGTTSTRCILFDRAGPVATSQKEHRQICPQPGWVEHDPIEIWDATQHVIRQAIAKAAAAPADIAAVAIANQRETTILWDKHTGRPYTNAIVWQDTRTRDICDALAADASPDRFRPIAGLPIATYFSASKIRWILDNFPDARQAADKGSALFGTIDSWLIWNLTGGPNGGLHLTDPTNASRTLLMNLHTLTWDDSLLDAFRIPRNILPTIVPSSIPIGTRQSAIGNPTTRPDGPFSASIPIAGILGDQQAALVGHACFQPGQLKNTYGTGCFMLLNTGQRIVHSKAGLLSTVAYQFAGATPVYALEGSIAVTGSLVQWLRDNLGLIMHASDIEHLAASVPDNGGVYFVPAFSGLFAPYWRSDARGVIVGLTRHATKAHLARAVLEATAYQVRDVLEAMRADCGADPTCLKVDGGMSTNNLLMQFQADILNLPLTRPTFQETTALGAAYAAGLAVGFWSAFDDLRANRQADKTWRPAMDPQARDRLYGMWKKAVERSLAWV